MVARASSLSLGTRSCFSDDSGGMVQTLKAFIPGMSDTGDEASSMRYCEDETRNCLAEGDSRFMKSRHLQLCLLAFTFQNFDKATDEV